MAADQVKGPGKQAIVVQRGKRKYTRRQPYAAGPCIVCGDNDAESALGICETCRRKRDQANRKLDLAAFRRRVFGDDL